MTAQDRTDAEETPTSKDGEAVPGPLRGVLDEPIDTKLQLFKHHADMAYLLAEEILEEDVEALVGERRSRNCPSGKSLQRWGYNPGSIRIDGEKVAIKVPRLRDKKAGEEHTLESYQAMKEAEVGEELTDSILLRLSQGDYGRVSSQFVDGFGLSQSSVSRRFQKRAQKALEEFESRSLEGKISWSFGSTGARCWRTGDHLHERDREGLQEGARLHTGNRRAPRADRGTASGLLDRGLSFEEEILCVVDGGRGLRKAIEEMFSGRAEIQRCRWHKRENVVSYLPKADQKKWRKKL